MTLGSLIKKIICSAVFFSFIFAVAASRPEAAAKEDYCVKPPFIVGSVKPNLLFMLDNSASMYDLIYVDNGSTTPLRKPSYCYDNTFKSTNSYAGYFDQAKIYSYDLDATDEFFYEDASGIPVSCTKRIAGHLCIDVTASGSTYTLDKFMASGKYLNWLTASKFDVQKKILTGGKYNTTNAMLLPETRGCIGRMFLKEAVTADFVDYAPAGVDTTPKDGRDDNDPNVSLGITFSVRGPENANNLSAPSPGGQTYLNIYWGDYNQAICQTSIDAYSDPTSSNAAIKKAVNDCLSYTQAGGKCYLNATKTCSVDSDCDITGGVCTPLSTMPTCSGTPKKCVGGAKAGQSCANDSQCKFSTCGSGRVGTVCGYITKTSSWDNSVCNSTEGPCIIGTVTTESKTQVTFNQTIQACWAKDNGTPIGTDEVNTVKNQCSDIYNEFYTCNGGANSGRTCTVATQLSDCGSGISCVNGPAAVRAGNPAYICSLTYAGMCGRTSDSWATTIWDQCTGTECTGCVGTGCGDICIKREHERFCGNVTIPPVTDPTDAPSDTSTFLNLPAIISDVGVEAQLNQPFRTLTVRIKDLSAGPVAPKGLLNDFSDTIRMGAMTFDFNGSPSECDRKVCSNSFLTTCTDNSSCSEGGLCINPVPCPRICHDNPEITCSTSLDCPNPLTATCENTIKPPTAGANNLDGAKVTTYISNSVGDHTTGLIKDIDDIKARTWTPFAEGFYNAIGYFARTDAYTVDPEVPGTSRTALRLNTDDFVANKNPSQYRCQDNNIMIISDGQPTAENNNTAVTSLVTLYNDGDGQTGYTATCPRYHGTMNLDDLAWLAKKRNIKTFSTSGTASTGSPANSSEQITTWVVYTGPSTTLTTECDPKVLMQHTATNGGTSLYNPQDPDSLKASLKDALNKIAAKTASGTAASVLASGEGSGANLIQALFYPKRRFGTTDIQWNGVLQNLWYYIDPYLGMSSIREDTNQDKSLSLASDYILQFTFADDETKANLFADANGNGTIDTPATPTVANVDFPDIKSLWEAGKLLQSRSPGSTNGTVSAPSGNRVIFTNLNDDGTLDNFDTSNAASLQPFVNVNVNVADDAPTHTQTVRLINYIRGMDDVSGGTEDGADTNPVDGKNDDPNDTIDNLRVRNRTVTIGSETGTWKLGDIVNATPKIVSWVPLNLYDKIYLDSTYKEFISAPDYRKRGMVYSGANDGMLHAFNLGLLGVYSGDTKATLGKACSTSTHTACRTAADCPGTTPTCDSDTTIGKELWSFIPKNALPYLKYFADPDYCHLYYIDSTPFIVDASINKPAACTETDYWNCLKTQESWRTVLVGGMRLGGACRNSSSDCKDCTKTPIADTGYSTYFALDITNPGAPTLLWEISSEALGYAMSGPAIVRIGVKQSDTNSDGVIDGLDAADNNKNGRWYAVFGSGPSGYVSPGSQQFLGITEHNNKTFPSSTPPGGRGDLRLFVYDLKSGSLLRTINVKDTYSDLYAAFAGSMVNGAIDLDQNQPSSMGFYQDDAVYFGYTSRAALGSDFTARDGDGSSNTIRLADGSSSTAGAYKGQFIHRYDGSHETKLITAYSGSGGTTTYNATVDSNWKDALPTATTTYNIFPGWTDGGVLRLITKQSLSPNDWVVSRVISGIGPVTAAVTKLQNYKNKNLRLFFGTGRYFYKVDDVIDDASSQRKLYGIVEPCYDAGIKTACNTASTALSVAASDLGNAADEAGSTDAQGWYIDLDLCLNESNAAVACSDASVVFRTERLVTDPLAITTGAVFFTTSSPTADICEYGGQSHLWAVKYDTGGSLAGTGVLKGKAIVQVSTGSIEEVDLGTAFTERQGRRSAPMQGLPPSGGLSIVVPPKPVDKILHMRKH